MFGIPQYGEHEGHPNAKYIKIKNIYLLVVSGGLISADLSLCFP